MQLIRCLHNLNTSHRGCVATIGNFDGVHKGHQAVCHALLADATAMSLPATVIIFEPQPLEFFAPEKAPSRLTRLREKLCALQSAGIERVLLLRFDQSLAELSAEDFIQQVLVDGLGIRKLYVGDDFRFGKGRQGDFKLLEQQGSEKGFKVSSLATIALDQERISSTRIRQCLQDGDLAKAAECLGRPYSIRGRVAHGHKRGRTIGFPTANIHMNRRITPLKGVYAVRMRLLRDNQWLPGVANIGNRPTVEGDDRYLLEVHLFDFDQDIYAEQVEVEMVQPIRDEKKFDSFDELRQQILKDADQARQVLGVQA